MTDREKEDVGEANLKNSQVLFNWDFGEDTLTASDVNKSGFLERMFENVPHGLIVFAIGESEEDRLFFINSAALQMLRAPVSKFKELNAEQKKILSKKYLNPRLLPPDVVFDLEKNHAAEKRILLRNFEGEEICFNCCYSLRGEDQQYLYVFMFHPDTGEDGDHTVLNKIRNMGIFGGNETPRICFDYDIHTGDMILFKASGDQAGQTTYMDRALVEFPQYRSRVNPDQLDEFDRKWKLALNSPKSDQIDYQFLNGKKYHWYRMKFQSLANQDGSVSQITGTIAYVQDEKETEHFLHDRFRLMQNADGTPASAFLVFETISSRRYTTEDDLLEENEYAVRYFPDFISRIMQQMHPDDQKTSKTTIDQVMRECIGHWRPYRTSFDARFRIKLGVEEFRWFKLDFLLTPGPRLPDYFLLFQITDIQDHKVEEMKLVEKARTDPLTGLLNREAFEEQCHRKQEHASEGKLYGFGFIYIDRFKNIIDRYGYPFADKVICQIAETFKAVMNVGDHCGRLGGDTFVICMDGHGSLEYLKERYRILKAALDRNIENKQQMTVSIGVVPVTGVQILSRGCSCFDAVYRMADFSLRKAKGDGGNRIVYYDPSLEEEYTAEKETQDKDQQELIVQALSSDIKEKSEVSGEPVYIRTFGYFDVFVNGQPVPFNHSKAKELLALLVDRRGGFVSSKEAISFLWEDEASNKTTHARYRKVAMWLHRTLDDYNIGDIIENHNGTRRIVPEKVRCDMYRYFADKTNSRGRFRGSYMLNYSWGETTYNDLTGLEE